MEPIDAVVSNFNEPFNNPEKSKAVVQELVENMHRFGLQHALRHKRFTLEAKIVFLSSILTAFATKSEGTKTIVQVIPLVQK